MDPPAGHEPAAPAWGRLSVPARRAYTSRQLSNELLDRLGLLDADQFLIQPAVKIGQTVGVEAELMEHGGVQVADVELAVHDGGGAQLVGGADADAALDAAAGQPHRKAV